MRRGAGSMSVGWSRKNRATIGRAPLRWPPAFTEKSQPQTVEPLKEWQASLHFLTWLRQQLVAHDRPQQAILFVGDGHYDHLKLWQALPRGVTLLARSAKNRVLHHLPDPTMRGNRKYGERAPKPASGLAQQQTLASPRAGSPRTHTPSTGLCARSARGAYLCSALGYARHISLSSVFFVIVDVARIIGAVVAFSEDVRFYTSKQLINVACKGNLHRAHQKSVFIFTLLNIVTLKLG